MAEDGQTLVPLPPRVPPTYHQRIMVKTLTGASVTFNPENIFTIRDLKAAVWQALGVPPDHQRLFAHGHQYQNGDPIMGWETYHLVLRLRGGMYDRMLVSRSSPATFIPPSGKTKSPPPRSWCSGGGGGGGGSGGYTSSKGKVRRGGLDAGEHHIPRASHEDDPNILSPCVPPDPLPMQLRPDPAPPYAVVIERLPPLSGRHGEVEEDFMGQPTASEAFLGWLDKAEGPDRAQVMRRYRNVWWW